MLRRVRFLPAHRSSVSPAHLSGPMSRALPQKKNVYARCLPRALISNYSRVVCFPRDSTWEHKGQTETQRSRRLFDPWNTRQGRGQTDGSFTISLLCTSQNVWGGRRKRRRNALSSSADHQTLTQLFAHTSCLHRSRPETAGAHAERWGGGWRGGRDVRPGWMSKLQRVTSASDQSWKKFHLGSRPHCNLLPIGRLEPRSAPCCSAA